MARYSIFLYSTTPEIECPRGNKHLLDAFVYNHDWPRREDAMRRRNAAELSHMAANGDTFAIGMLRAENAVAKMVPASFPKCECGRGYQLQPWSPHYERPDEAMY